MITCTHALLYKTIFNNSPDNSISFSAILCLSTSIGPIFLGNGSFSSKHSANCMQGHSMTHHAVIEYTFTTKLIIHCSLGNYMIVTGFWKISPIVTFHDSNIYNQNVE